MSNSHLKFNVENAIPNLALLPTPTATPIAVNEDWVLPVAGEQIMVQSMSPVFLSYPRSNSSTNLIGFTLRIQPPLTISTVSTWSKPSLLILITTRVKSTLTGTWFYELWQEHRVM